MLLTILVGRELVISGPGGFADQTHHAAPLVVAGASNDDPIILAVTWIAAVGCVRFAKNFSVAHRIPFIVINRVVENCRSHHGALSLEHAGFDELAFSGSLFVFQRREHTNRHRHRANPVGPSDLTAGFHRRIRIAPEPHDPGVGEELPTPGNPGFKRSGQSPTWHDGLYDSRVDSLQLVEAKAKTLQNTRAEVIDYRIRLRDQLLEKLFALRTAQVYRATKLGAIHTSVHRGFAFFASHDRGLDLDYFHAVVGQQFRTEWPRVLLR